MNEKIKSLITDDGTWLPVSKRTAAVIIVLYQLQKRIEACSNGGLQITLDVKGDSVRHSIKEFGEPTKIG